MSFYFSQVFSGTPDICAIVSVTSLNKLNNNKNNNNKKAIVYFLVKQIKNLEVVLSNCSNNELQRVLRTLSNSKMQRFAKIING